MFEIQSGTQRKAIKCTIYGPEGIGKSSLAAQFPNPLFIDTEDSTTHMDVKRLKKPSSWSELMQMLNWIKNDKPCSTIIIDTADWAQTLAEKDVINEKGVTSIEDIGYGKGYVFMRDRFGNMLDKLSEIKDEGINVVLTAHSQIKKFEDPAEMGAYDRYELKLAEKSNASIAGVVKEWADMVLFLNYEVISVKASDMGDKYKAQGGKRVMHTTHHPAWDAKNRYGLPDKLPLEYNAIGHIIPNMVKPNTLTEKNVAKETMYFEHDGTGEFIKVNKGESLEFLKQGEILDQRSKEEYENYLNNNSSASPKMTPAQREVYEDMGKETPSAPDYLPKELRDLMTANGITEDELKGVAGLRGHFPINTDFETISKTSPEYFTGGLVANWDSVVGVVKNLRSNPQSIVDLWTKVIGNEEEAKNKTAAMNIEFNE